MQKTRKISYLPIIVLYLFIVQTIASKAGGFIAGLFDYSFIDKDGTFMYITVHHLVQMIIALLFIFIIARKSGLKFFLKPMVSKAGILYTAIFAVVILIYVLISYGVGYAIGSIAPYEYELNAVNVLGTLGFQLFLSGSSEEILFRALPVTLLVSLDYKSRKKGIISAVLIAAVLFSIAHIKWGIMPFTLSFSWFQLVYAFILGIAYGVTYLKSESVIYPMIMHGLSNFFMVGIGYIFAVVME